MPLKQWLWSLIWVSMGLWSLNCAGPTRLARQPQPQEAVARVLSWNVNYGLAGDPVALALLERSDADIIFLQETTPRWEESLRASLSERYPYMSFVHTLGAGGLAVLSRRPFAQDDAMAPVGDGWFPALRVVAQTPIGEVQALQVHLRPPISDSGSVVSGYLQAPEIHRAEIEVFASPQALPLDRPTLIVGDFNEDHDGAAASWLRARGLKGALQEFAPDATTWRWATSLGEVTHTLDHIYYNDALEPLDARALPQGRSDHLPLVAVFTAARATP